MHIQVLRLSHRLPRDERISTHVALVARAFGASSIIYTGQHDSGLERSVERICAQWGGRTAHGEFHITYEKSAISFIKRKKKDGFLVAHLTMYGRSVEEKVSELKKDKLLIIVGSEHVPGQIYQLADLNISVTNQPHSEVAALAITLDRVTKQPTDFGGKVHVLPTERGKKVEKG